MAQITRDRLEIIESILSICKNGNATAGNIANQTDLNYSTARSYLEMLINRNIILEDNNSYLLTSKGDDILLKLRIVSPILLLAANLNLPEEVIDPTFEGSPKSIGTSGRVEQDATYSLATSI